MVAGATNVAAATDATIELRLTATPSDKNYQVTAISIAPSANGEQVALTTGSLNNDGLEFVAQGTTLQAGTQYTITFTLGDGTTADANQGTASGTVDGNLCTC